MPTNANQRQRVPLSKVLGGIGGLGMLGAALVHGRASGWERSSQGGGLFSSFQAAKLSSKTVSRREGINEDGARMAR